MNKIGLATAFALLVSVLTSIPARSEAPIAPAGCPTRKIVLRSRDPVQPISITGRVTQIEYGKQQRVALKNMVMWLRLKTDRGEEMPVYLGSSWYLSQKQLQVRVGDKLEIKGVKPLGTELKSSIAIANTIKRGNRTWKASIPKQTNLVKSCQI